jgi:hypothetical protein
LARRLDEAGIGYVRYDNALVRIDDLEAASRLCERFAHKAWPRVLNAFARRVNPIMGRVRAAGFGGYYWVLDQAEIATDVMFSSRPKLLDIWPDLVHHAALNMGAEDVLGFLGRKLHPVTGGRGRDRHQAPPRGLAGPPPHGPQLGEGLRQGVRLAGRDGHQQSA